MAVDLTKSAAGTKPKSAEIRNNFIALKGLIDAEPATGTQYMQSIMCSEKQKEKVWR